MRSTGRVRDNRKTVRAATGSSMADVVFFLFVYIFFSPFLCFISPNSRRVYGIALFDPETGICFHSYHCRGVETDRLQTNDPERMTRAKKPSPFRHQMRDKWKFFSEGSPTQSVRVSRKTNLCGIKRRSDVFEFSKSTRTLWPATLIFLSCYVLLRTFKYNR